MHHHRCDAMISNSYSVEGLDPEITRYEAMTAEEVHTELARYGIDPRPTIEVVKRLVIERLDDWRRRPRRR